MGRVLVSHRTTLKNYIKIKESMKLKANFPSPNFFLTRLFDGKEEVVWVKVGKVSMVDFFLTGKYLGKGKGCIEFYIDERKIRKPRGAKYFIEWRARVIDGDVNLQEDTVFKEL